MVEELKGLSLGIGGKVHPLRTGDNGTGNHRAQIQRNVVHQRRSIGNCVVAEESKRHAVSTDGVHLRTIHPGTAVDEREGSKDLQHIDYASLPVKKKDPFLEQFGVRTERT